MEGDFIENQKNYNLTNDYFFKRIFGKIGNENITKDLINSILETPINSISLNESPILEKDLIDDKIGILDIKATLNNNVPCDLEMQIAPNNYLAERVLWYWAKLYSSQIKQGDKYSQIHKTIAILFAVEPINRLKDIPDFKTKWQIREEKHHTVLLTEALEIYIISLDKFQKIQKNKSIENTSLSQWANFILEPEKLEKNMVDNENIKEAKEIYDEINNDEHERYLAEQRQIIIMDKRDSERTGYENGMEEGLKKGTLNALTNVIKNLLSMKLSIDDIAKATNLSFDEISRIIKENNL